MKKNILVVNDDGIDALGIHRLAEALSEIGNIYVCAPHTQQSGSGHGLSIGKPVYVEYYPFREAVQAISMEGLPADCVKQGIEIFRARGIEMDMVFSGINHGHNLGTDTLYSGTVSAAVEGAFCGLPSAAISISCNLVPNQREPIHFDVALKLAKKIAKSDLFANCANGAANETISQADNETVGNKAKVPDIHFIHKDHIILNVNIPDLPEDEVKGVKVCPLSFRAYDEWFKESKDGTGRTGYTYSGYPRIIGDADPDESDIIAHELGYATITPLQFDLTDKKMIGRLRSEWSFD